MDTTLAAWSSPAWRADAVAWADEHLTTAGIERTDEAEQTQLRPWATVLRIPTTSGPVWMKAAGSGTAFEAGLYEVLARTVPKHVLVPIATDPARGWMLLPDGGPSLGDRGLEGTTLAIALTTALVEYGRLQRALAPHAGELLAAGAPDMRPDAMPQRLHEAIAAVGDDGGDVPRRAAAMEAQVTAWCERLAASPIPASLDHNDLHPWNILGETAQDTRFYDWGDSVVAHPFAAMLVPLGFLHRALGKGLDDPWFLRGRDAYLEVFADLAPLEELRETLETACRVAKIARVLTWDRALRAAREQGEELDAQWVAAPRSTLASLLNEDYLGGA